jgi:methylthioribose-1-phosphate isomerase
MAFDAARPLPPPTVRWEGGLSGHLVLLDQTRLPGEIVEHACRSLEEVWEAIRALRVRGAPAIGIAAAYGVVLGVRDCLTGSAAAAAREKVFEASNRLATSRPTAVNLFWAIDRMLRAAATFADDGDGRALAERLLAEARAIHEEDRAACRAIGRQGEKLLADGDGVLTHCNAGGLATSEYGTALACIFAAHEAGKRLHVYVDETRPLLQGARLTAWELVHAGIETTLICDSMAAQVMREGRVQAVITGADRIARNGDVANKIGTYGLALLAAAHEIPFYVAAPTNTIDVSLATGNVIPIEQRPAEEITHASGRPTAPPGIRVYNPAFDVTPATLVRAIVTEQGVLAPSQISSLPAAS